MVIAVTPLRELFRYFRARCSFSASLMQRQSTPKFRATSVMASRQLDECASRLPVGISDCGVSAKLDLQLGLGDDLQKPPLKSVNAVCILYVQSLHVLSFQLLRVKSDEYSKPAPEINA